MEEIKYLLTEEAASEIFQGWLDYYEIKFEHIVNDQGREGAETLKNKIIEAIRKGQIETNMNENPSKGFQIIQHTSTKKTITYDEYNFSAAREAGKQKDQTSATFALLGKLSGHGLDWFGYSANMRGPDLKLAEYIAVLFLL